MHKTTKALTLALVLAGLLQVGCSGLEVIGEETAPPTSPNPSTPVEATQPGGDQIEETPPGGALSR